MSDSRKVRLGRGRARAAFLALLVALSAAVLAGSFRAALAAAQARPFDLALLVALSAALMLFSVELGALGTISLVGVLLLATGFQYGVGAGTCVALCAVGVASLGRRPRAPSALLDAGTLALATAAASEIFILLPHAGSAELAAALAAGAVFWAVGAGLLAGWRLLSEARGFAGAFDRRVLLGLHTLAVGPLALACAIALTRVGLLGLLACALAAALVLVSIREYVSTVRSRDATAERVNGELARANADLRDLYDATRTLSAPAENGRALADQAEAMLVRLLGGRVEISLGGELDADETALVVEGRVVGGLRIEGHDGARWARLCEAILPELASSLAAALGGEELRATQFSTIAALSRSLEAKAANSGAQSERVSQIAVALGRRLGFYGADLDAISIGALLHDIGKVGIPEAILHKSGPLDNDEWTVMKRHPVVSEFILNGADLHPFVVQIARSSHERLDGHGYPDGLAGNAIPLPARIVLVANAFDALTTDRPYRRARRPRAALDEIVSNAGKQFCPLVVAALERLYQHEPALLGELERLTIVA